MSDFMNEPVSTTSENAYTEPVSEEKEIAGESKADKFKRIATHRTNDIIKKIKTLSQVSSNAYEYTPEQVEKIFGALQKALDEAKAKFMKEEKKTDDFSL